MNNHQGIENLMMCHTSDEAIACLKKIYNQSSQGIKNHFEYLLESDEIESFDEYIPAGNRYYPYLGISIPEDKLHHDGRLAYGIAWEPGVYSTTITQPQMFEAYLKEQLDLLIQHHQVPIMVGTSRCPIPLHFVVENSLLKFTPEKARILTRDFVVPNLSRVNDSIANNRYVKKKGGDIPLSLFSAERIDYSLERLHYYTATSPEYFQDFVLLTNYQRYIHEFIDYAKDQIKNHDEYVAFVQPGDHIMWNERFSNNGSQDEIMAHLPQMPAYHLIREDKQGISFINIGVGPSNAKTMTDHLAVLRPHCWIMLGHCAGLRKSQQLGDYVLAHGYFRDDHILDADLPVDIPIPAIAEVQVALEDAVVNVTGLKGAEMKSRMRTGTVMTTDNRNWELRSEDLREIFNQSRTIAVDMESATIAANGFRYRVPYGTLLCVSDKPLHGELKLKTMAKRFFKDRVSQHLMAGIETVKLLRSRGTSSLHSRKLRGIDEPPFR